MPSSRVRVLLRYGLVFAVVLGALSLLAGERLVAPSRDNHFVRLAHGWLDGRMALVAQPPGWCSPRQKARKQCRGHTFDDYAVVHTLTGPDGTSMRGYPCRTESCALARRRGEDMWWIIGEGWRSFDRGTLGRESETWFITFPPGPALMMLPVVAVTGLGTWDVLLTCIAAAFIPVVLVHMLDRERGTARGRSREHLWLAAAWALASPACVLGAHGRVWFTAQIMGALCLVLYLSCAWGARKPLWAGVWLGLAVACRPINMLPTVVVFVLEWWRLGRRPAAAVRFLAPLAVIGVALAWHNWVRFEDPLEFGHRFLEIRWQARMQQVGMFSFEYLPRNLRCLLWLAPQIGAHAPYLRLSIHGIALWMSSPWIVAIAASGDRFVQRRGLWLGVVGAAVPSLLYQNSGQLQPVYRFSVDWLPMMLLLIGMGGGARRRWFPVLVVGSIVLHGWMTWEFGRHPGRLFVHQPVGWPFEHESAPAG